jgi:hypothetical protein
MKLFGIIIVGFDITDQLLIRSFAFKKAYDSVRREVLCNILIRVWGTHETSEAD